MEYNLNHDNLLDSMLVAYLSYSVNDPDLKPEMLWIRVNDVMQHLSQQGLAEFLLMHVDGTRCTSRLCNMRLAMYKLDEDIRARKAAFVPPPEAE